MSEIGHRWFEQPEHELISNEPGRECICSMHPYDSKGRERAAFTRITSTRFTWTTLDSAKSTPSINRVRSSTFHQSTITSCTCWKLAATAASFWPRCTPVNYQRWQLIPMTVACHLLIEPWGCPSALVMGSRSRAC